MESYTRYKFSDIFQDSTEDYLVLKKPIEISGIKFQSGIRIQKGVALGGIDFHLFRGRDIAVVDKQVRVTEPTNSVASNNIATSGNTVSATSDIVTTTSEEATSEDFLIIGGFYK